jgi:hypothetical protein
MWPRLVHRDAAEVEKKLSEKKKKQEVKKFLLNAIYTSLSYGW